jgi:heme-degrading monooxygenase HmoA
MLVMTKKVFVYVWDYLVKEEYLEEFKRIYGPAGDWAQLFGKANGYIATDLHQDISDPKRFITVDFWKSKDDRDNFRDQFSKEFRSLDEYCESFTKREKLIGDFNSYINRFSDKK